MPTWCNVGLVLWWGVSGASAAACDIVVQISGFRDAVGNGGAAIFQSADGFPRHGEKALRKAPGTIEHGAAVIVFKDLPPGRYAVAALHDRNSNGKLDSNFLGIPKEGFAVSNHPERLFRPPSFESSVIACEGTQALQVPLKLQYPP